MPSRFCQSATAEQSESPISGSNREAERPSDSATYGSANTHTIPPSGIGS
jgi:hypothetical protein